MAQDMVANSSEGIQYPNDFVLKDISLTTLTGDSHSLFYMFFEVNVYENLFTPGLHGDIEINDSHNLLVNLPIAGHELLSLKFESPTMGEVSQTFRVFSISNKTIIKDRAQKYVLHFVSPEVVLNAQTKVSRSWNFIKAEEIVKSILELDLKTTKPIIVEPSLYEMNYVCPSLRPFDAIRWLQSRSITEETKSPTYVFCERQDGYIFTSTAKLFGVEPNIIYTYQPTSSREGASLRTIPKDMVGIESYTFLKSLDMIASSKGGMFANQTTVVNPTKKRWDTYTYDYAMEYEKSPHMEPAIKNTGQGKTMLGSDVEGNFTKTPHQHLIWTTDPYQPWDKQESTKAEEWLPARTSWSQQLDTICLRMIVPGDSRRRVGHMVEVRLPSVQPIGNDGIVYDYLYSGKYMIAQIRHQLQPDGYRLHMDLRKDSYANPLPASGGSHAEEVNKTETELATDFQAAKPQGNPRFF